MTFTNPEELFVLPRIGDGFRVLRHLDGLLVDWLPNDPVLVRRSDLLYRDACVMLTTSLILIPSEFSLDQYGTRY